MKPIYGKNCLNELKKHNLKTVLAYMSTKYINICNNAKALIKYITHFKSLKDVLETRWPLLITGKPP